MKKIWSILKDHVRLDFHPGLYIAIAAFLGLAIVLNYSVNLENGIIDRDAGKAIRIVWYMILYGGAYYIGCWITFFFTGKQSHFASPRFWVYSLLGLLILSFHVGFPYLMAVTNAVVNHSSLFSWAFKVTANLINFGTTALPLMLFAIFIDRNKEYFGVNRNQIDLKPYWQLLLVIVPTVAIASFEPGFKNYYPMYKSNTVAETMGWHPVVPVLIYELAYGLDFFNIELMFRGFLVIGMSRILGKDAILPMVCVYCCLHFGKPPGEAISSIVGGYILGVVAFSTRNIWGGVMVHIGLAWMMELAAFLQKLRA